MEITVHPKGQDAGARQISEVGFDMLRSVFVARQASTATVRALSSARAGSAAVEDETASASTASLSLLTGRRHSAAGPMGGAFANHSVNDHPVAKKGELHG